MKPIQKFTAVWIAIGLVILLALAVLKPPASHAQQSSGTTYGAFDGAFAAPAFSGVGTATLAYTAGTIYNGGNAVAIAPGTITSPASSLGNCTNTAIAAGTDSCAYVYWQTGTGGFLQTTLSYQQAIAPGSVFLAFCTTDANRHILSIIPASLQTQQPAVGLAYFQNQISGAVTLGTSSYTPASGTFPAVTTLSAGTWAVDASVNLQTASTANGVDFTCQLYDGTNVLASGYILTGGLAGAAVENFQVSLHAVAVETAAVTFTAQCTSSTAAQLMENTGGANDTGNHASTITALRIQ